MGKHEGGVKGTSRNKDVHEEPAQPNNAVIQVIRKRALARKLGDEFAILPVISQKWKAVKMLLSIPECLGIYRSPE